MKRTIWSTSALVAISVSVAACSGGGSDASPATTVAPTTEAPTTTVEPTTTTVEPTTTTSTTVVETTTTIPEVLRQPLTGEPIDDVSAIPDRPAIVAKLSNAGTDARPQAGLNATDLVIEEVINDSATRLAAVFHTQDVDPVGPVRSGRAQDINLLMALDRPLFAWSGGNGAVTAAIRNSDLIDLSMQHASGYYRRSGRKGPNNVFTSTEALWAQTTDEAGRPPQVFEYLMPGEEPVGEPATEIDVTLDSVDAHWEYDADSGRYYRWQDGAEHNTEMADGNEQVWVDNLVVMMADYGVNSFDGNPDAQVLGSNPVYVFTGGTVRVGVWLRFELTDPYGMFGSIEALDPIGLTPGRTWMEIPRNKPDSISYG